VKGVRPLGDYLAEWLSRYPEYIEKCKGNEAFVNYLRANEPPKNGEDAEWDRLMRELGAPPS
jgi:hypothetical protein